MGPNFGYAVSLVSGQIQIVMSEAGDTLTLLFDNRGQALEILRDLMLQVNSA
jgi:hypothetical protein